jgi:hypothetical protein
MLTVVTSRRMRWVGHVTCIVQRSVDGRMILKWILKKLVRRAWTVLIWLRIGTSGRLFRYLY